MADTKKTVEILFDGTDNASKVIKNIGDNIDGLGSGIQDFTGPFSDLTANILKAEAAFAALAAGGLALAYSKSVEFDSALVGLKKVLGDVSQGEIDSLRTEILGLSDDYGIASTAVTESVTGWKQAGFDTAESLKLVKNALDLKIAGDISAAQSTETLTSILKGFKLEAGEAGRAVDIMNEVSNNYATDVQQLGIAMGDLSPVANTMGFTMEETAGLVTPIIEVFRSGSEASTSLRTGLLKLVDDAKPVQEALAKLGVSQKDANGQMRSGKDIFYDVAAAFKNLDENQKLVITSQLVGTEQAARMTEVFNQLGKVQEITAKAMESSGSAADEVAARMKSSQVVIDKFKTSFTNLAIELGDNFRPAIDGIIVGLTDVEGAIAKASKSGAFDELYKAFGEFGEEAEKVLKKVAEALPEALAAVDFSVLTKAISGLGDSAGGLFDSFFDGVDLTTPEGLTAAIQDIVDAMAGFQDVVSGILESFEPFVDIIGDAIRYFGDMSSESKELAGNFLGFATQAGMAAGALAGIGLAIKGAGGALEVIEKLGGVGLRGADSIGKLTASLGPAGLVGAAALAGLEIGRLINNLPGVQEGVQGVIAEVDNFLGGVFSAGPTLDEMEKIDNAFFAAQQQAAKLREESEGVSESLGSIPGETKADIATNAEEAQAKLAGLGETVDGLTTEELKLAIGYDEAKSQASVAKAKQEFETLSVFLEDGTEISIQVPIDQASKEQTKKELEELVPPDKKLELQVQLEVAQIEADAEKFAAQMEALQTSVEWEAKLDIAQVEANAQQVEAAFESINTTIQSTGDVISESLGLLIGLDDFGNALEKFTLTEQIKKENELRERAIALQEKLTQQQIVTMQDLSERLNSDEPMKLTLNTDNLSPALQLVWEEIITELQDQAVLEGGSMLVSMLGASA